MDLFHPQLIKLVPPTRWKFCPLRTMRYLERTHKVTCDYLYTQAFLEFDFDFDWSMQCNVMETTLFGLTLVEPKQTYMWPRLARRYSLSISHYFCCSCFFGEFEASDSIRFNSTCQWDGETASNWSLHNYFVYVFFDNNKSSYVHFYIHTWNLIDAQGDIGQLVTTI